MTSSFPFFFIFIGVTVGRFSLKALSLLYICSSGTYELPSFSGIIKPSLPSIIVIFFIFFVGGVEEPSIKIFMIPVAVIVLLLTTCTISTSSPSVTSTLLSIANPS